MKLDTSKKGEIICLESRMVGNKDWSVLKYYTWQSFDQSYVEDCTPLDTLDYENKRAKLRHWKFEYRLTIYRPCEVLDGKTRGSLKRQIKAQTKKRIAAYRKNIPYILADEHIPDGMRITPLELCGPVRKKP